MNLTPDAFASLAQQLAQDPQLRQRMRDAVTPSASAEHLARAVAQRGIRVTDHDIAALSAWLCTSATHTPLADDALDAVAGGGVNKPQGPATFIRDRT